MRALRFALLAIGFASALAFAGETVTPKDGAAWGGGSAQDMLNMTHDPSTISKDEGRDPEQAQVSNICTTKNGEYYREGEQGYDACRTEMRNTRATAGVKPVSTN